MNGTISRFLGRLTGRRALFARVFGGAALLAALPAAGNVRAAEPPAAAPGGATFGIWTGNIERSSAFYKALGCEVSDIHFQTEKLRPAADLTPAIAVRNCFLNYKGTRMELTEAKPLNVAVPGPPLFQAGVVHVAFRTDDVDRMMEIADKSGGKVLKQTLMKVPGAEIATVFCFDPDGVRLQFIGPSKKAV